MDSDFHLSEKVIYLNHAAVAPWPKSSADAVSAFAVENQTFGATHYLKWLEKEHSLRILLAKLINAPSADDIALVKNTSEGLSMIAWGIDWTDGDNIVIPDCEFPSNRIVWQSLAEKNIEVRQVDILTASDPEQAIINACDSQTRLVSVSSVQYASGFRLNLPLIGEWCHKQDILFCVDAIQSIGALPFDAQACYADFVVADGHKWMLGPEGIALFYSTPQGRDRLRLYEYGWHMTSEPGNFNRHDWEINPTAQRFECGSPNMLGIHALHASVELLLAKGMECIGQAVIEKTQRLIDEISRDSRLQLCTDPRPERLSGITAFDVKNHDLQPIYQQLMANNVICALRGNAIRFSPHFYTHENQLVDAMRMVISIIDSQ